MKNILLGLMILASISSFAGNAQSIEIEIPENYGVNSDLDKLCVINAGSDYKFQEGTIVPAQGEVITLDSGGSESIASGAKYMVTKSISCKKVSDLSNVCQNSAGDAEGYVWVCPRFKNQAISACHHARSTAERSVWGRATRRMSRGGRGSSRPISGVDCPLTADFQRTQPGWQSALRHSSSRPSAR